MRTIRPAEVPTLERERDERPWGLFEVLEEGEHYKVKRVEVLPGGRLSPHRHRRRSEHWVVVRGRGLLSQDGADLDEGDIERLEDDYGRMPA